MNLRVIAITLLVFFLSSASFAQDRPGECLTSPGIEESSVGFSTDPETGLPRISVGASAELGVAVTTCGGIQEVVFELPDELALRTDASACVESIGREVRCRAPSGRTVDGGGQEQVVRVPIRASEIGDAQLLRWTALPIDRQSRESSVSVFSQEIVLGGTTIQIGAPANGQVFAVNPGDTLALSTRLTYTDTLVDAVLSLPSFTYQSFSPVVPNVTCTGSGSTATCTNGSAGEHEAVINWQAPLTAGTYNGTYIAEACGPQTPNPLCSTDSTNFSVIVGTDCEVAVSKSWSSAYVNSGGQPAVYEGLPFRWDIQVFAPGANGSNATGIQVFDSLPSNNIYTGFTGTGWSCSHSGGTAAGGGLVTCSYSGSLTPGQAAPLLRIEVVPSSTASSNNRVDVTSSSCSPGFSEATVVPQPLGGLSSISVSKSGPATVTFGDQFDWTINVTNSGPNAASNFELVDTLPAGVSFVGVTATTPISCSQAGGTVTCSAGSLPVGSYTITLRVQANVVGNLTNVCVASSDGGTVDDSACDSTVPSTAVADLGISKTGPSSAVAGGPMNYTVSVSNSGPNTATSVVVEDVIPNGLNFLNATGVGWSCTQLGGPPRVRCTRPSISFGSSSGFNLSFSVAPWYTDATLTNCADVSSAVTDPNMSNNSDCHGIPINRVADLSIGKTGPAQVNAAESFSYVLDVENIGPSNASNITVSDTVPAGVSISSVVSTVFSCSTSGSTVTCTRPTLDVSQSGTITLNVVAPNQGGSINNCASVGSTVTDPNSANNNDCHPTTVIAQADLAINKSGPTQVNAADAFSYTLAVENLGPSTAAAVVVEDTLPAGVGYVSASGGPFSCSETGGLVSCTVASMSSGFTGNITLNVIAPNQGGSINNCGAIRSNTADPNTANNNDCHSTTVVAQADLALNKSGPAEVDATEAFSYSLGVSNIGPSTADVVLVEDTLPPGVGFVSASGSGFSCTETGGLVSCTRASMTSGFSGSITLNVVAPTEGGSIENCGEISSNTADPVISNNRSCHTTLVVPRAELAIEKTSVTNPVLAGEVIEWVISVTNAGPSTAADVFISDSLPVETTFVSVTPDVPFVCSEAGGEISCSTAQLPVGSYEIVIHAIAPDQPQQVTNLCELTAETAPPPVGDPIPPLPGTPGTILTCDDTVDVERAVNISLAKSSIDPVVVAGSEFQYSIVVSNAGPSDAIDLVVSDSLPAEVTFIAGDSVFACNYDGVIHAVDCSIPTLAAGADVTLTLTVRAPDEGGNLTNTCVATYPGVELDPTTLTCEADTEVTPESDLTISKSVSAPVIPAGQPFSYTITLFNDGPSTAENVVITDDLPPLVSFVGVSAHFPLNCSEAGGVVTCEAASLPVGAYAITIDVTAPLEGAQFSNFCVFESTTDDPTPILPEDCDDGGVVIDPRSELNVVKSSVQSPVLAGGLIEWEISLTNTGPSTAEDVVVTDTLPAAVTLQAVGGDAPLNCGAVGNTITCEAASLPVGTYGITIQAVAPDEPQIVTNVCVLDSSTAPPDGSPGPDVCEDSVEVERAVDISLSKTSSPPVVTAGTEFDYVIEVSNAGPSDAVDVAINDPLPAGVTFVSVNAPFACNYSAGTNALDCLIPLLAAGDSTSLTMTVRAPDEAANLTNVCVATYPGTELDPSTLTCEADTEVTPESDLSVSKTPSASVVPVDQPFFYTIVVTNDGPSTAENVSIQDPLPTEVTFLNVNADAPFACSEVGGTVSCSAAQLPVGSYSIVINVQAPSEGATFTNVCVVNVDTSDPTPILPEDCDDGGVVAQPLADIQLTKFVQSGGVPLTSIEAGSAFSWVIEVVNLGPSTAEAVQIVDDVPAAFTVTGYDAQLSAGGNFNCSITGNSLSCAVGDLAANDEAVIELFVTAPNEGGDFTNICVYTSDTDDPNPSSCESPIEVTPVADLQIEKMAYIEVEGEFGPETEVVTEVDASSEFFYSVTVTNQGPSTAESVVLVDDFPVEADVISFQPTQGACALTGTTLTCDQITLASGDSFQLTVQAMAPGLQTTLTNLASVSSPVNDNDLSNNDVEHLLGVIENPVLGLAKGVTLVEAIAPEEFEARLMFTVRNYGNVPLENIQVVDDFSTVFPAGMVWSVSDLAVEGDLSGINLGFDGLNDINMLSGIETLPVNGEATIRLRVQFQPGLTTGPYLNQAFASGVSTISLDVLDTSHNGLDPNPDATHPNNHSDPTPIQFLEDPAIGLAKTVEGVEYVGERQQRFDIAILVRNFGNVPLLDVQVNDSLADTFVSLDPAQLIGVSAVTVDGDLIGANPSYDGVVDTSLLIGDETLLVDGSATIRFSVTVELGPDDVGPYWNSGTGRGMSPGDILAEDISQDGIDPNPSGSGDPTDDNDPTPVIPLISDIAVSKALLTQNPAPQQTLTWEISVTNLGPDTAHDIVIIDTLPANVVFQSFDQGAFSCAFSAGNVTCSLAQLLLGETSSFRISATAPADGGDVVNTCSGELGIPDPDLGNNACSVSNPVDPVSDVTVIKEAVGPVYAGQPFAYILTVTNSGPSTASDVVIVDALPTEVAFQSVDADAPFSCVNSNGVVTCTADSLPVGAYTIEIGVVASESLDPITNICSLAASSELIGTGDSLCEATVTPEPSAALTMEKFAEPAAVQPGSTFEWVLRVRQDGPSEATGVVIADDVPLPSQVLGVQADAAFNCTIDSNLVTCNAATLPVGIYEIRISTQAPSEPGPITNVCVIETGSFNPGADPGCDGVVVIDDEVTLLTSAWPDKGTVAVGETWRYTVQLENVGALGATFAGLDIGLSGPADRTSVAITGDGVCESIDAAIVDCSTEWFPDGSQLFVYLDMMALSQGIHNLQASAYSTTPLSSDSVLNADASVDILGAGLPPGPDAPIPIPTMSRVGQALMLVLILIMAHLVLRKTIRRQRLS